MKEEQKQAGMTLSFRCCGALEFELIGEIVDFVSVRKISGDTEFTVIPCDYIDISKYTDKRVLLEIINEYGVAKRTVEYRDIASIVKNIDGFSTLSIVIERAK